ncbi:MAG: c-type cytochrome [Proteobacteria bacterium]|nr:c-type cytochrome [Pseudomonadota bacterium]
MRVAFAISGALLTVSLVVAAMQDISRDWQEIQVEYKDLAVSRANNNRLREAVRQIETGIKQDFLPQLDRSDRCRTCHLGIENPSMKGAKEPHAAHPGTLLEHHPPERFGCTVCHQGQGLATTAVDAHANEIEFWDEPMLEHRFIEATCEQCHRDEDVKGATVLNDGRRLFSKKGCAGCHKTYGKGGTLGAELTNLGKASPYIKHPAEKNLAQYTEMAKGDVNLAYILESIKEPGAQPESTTMPTYVLSNWELKALTVYVKSLSDIDLPAAYKPVNALLKPDSTGKELFVRYCSACHGKHGEGGVRIGRMGTTLNNDDFLSLASDKFIRGIIRLGRNSHNKVMPAWGEGAGGLSNDEIDKVVNYIVSWKTTAPDTDIVYNQERSIQAGMEHYQRVCADCHGTHREGRIGPSLVSPELFQIASTRFLYETITKGRPGTAMPGWNALTKEQLSSLLAFLLSHDKPNVEVTEVSPNGDRGFGEEIFLSHCSTCHGRRGEGGIGPSLNSPEMAALADDGFWIQTVVKGRKDSGMPAWSQLPADQLSAVIAYLGTLATPARIPAVLLVDVGDPNQGKEDYEGVCAACHGTHGQGGTGPAIGAAEFLDVASDRFIASTIKYGRFGTEMRPHGLVPSAMAGYADAEIGDIVAFVRTLGSASKTGQTIRGSVGAGAEWYGRVCINCHGDQGRGGIGPALANPRFLEVATDGFLQAQMALGRSGTEMRPVTPFAGGIVEIDRAKINDIIAYLRHCSDFYTSESSNMQTAFGSVENGAKWFGSVCSKCHGAYGKGTVAAPGLNDPTFLRYATDGFLQGTMIRGRMHTGMRAFGKHGDGIASLTAREISDVAAYIRSWANPMIGQAQESTFEISAQTSFSLQKKETEE